MDTPSLNTSSGDCQTRLYGESVSIAWGGDVLLERVSFQVGEGQAILISGGNGAGKTSFLNMLSGFLKPRDGRVVFQNGALEMSLVGMSPERIALSGIGRLWQDIRLFPNLSVLDNLLVCSSQLIRHNPFQLWRSLFASVEKRERERALQCLSLMEMADQAEILAGRLSLGQMKRVALARLWMSHTRFFLLDEPFAGLDQASAEQLCGLIHDLKQDGKSLIIVEHRGDLLRNLCDETWFLGDGSLRTSEGVAA